MVKRASGRNWPEVSGRLSNRSRSEAAVHKKGDPRNHTKAYQKISRCFVWFRGSLCRRQRLTEKNRKREFCPGDRTENPGAFSLLTQSSEQRIQTPRKRRGFRR